MTATKEKLGFNVKGREVIGGNGSYELRESAASYKAILGHEVGFVYGQKGLMADISLEGLKFTTISPQ